MHLNEGIELALSVPSTYLHVCGLLQRSYLHLLAADRQQALDDLGQGLRLMKEQGYSYFWSWEPVMMTRLLSEAVAAGIETEFAKVLARKRLRLAINAEGKFVPLLQITLLDKFGIMQGRKRFLPSMTSPPPSDRSSA